MADFMDNLIGWTGALGTIALLLWGTHADAWERGRQEAVRGFECPKGSVYQIVRHDTGETKCVLPWEAIGKAVTKSTRNAK